MSETNKSSRQMSEDDAKKEHDDIQREIAESKGQKYTPDDEKKEEKPDEEKEIKEPEVDLDETKDDKSKEKTEVTEEDEEDLVDPPEQSEKPRKKSLVDRFRETKAEKDEALGKLSEKDKEIARLNAELNKTKTADQMKDKVKVYAEKHGISEEAALDLVLLAKEAIAPDESTRAVLEESKALIQKNKAIEAFESEFSSLVRDVPEAAEMRDKIRAEAYKEQNLEKSLFELYYRLPKSEEPPKRKTGESSRGAPGRGTQTEVFNVKAIAEKVKAGSSGSLAGLSGEQQDQVFAYLEKQGSRYN